MVDGLDFKARALSAMLIAYAWYWSDGVKGFEFQHSNTYDSILVVLFQQYLRQLILQHRVVALKHFVQLPRVLQFELVGIDIFRHQRAVDQIGQRWSCFSITAWASLVP